MIVIVLMIAIMLMTVVVTRIAMVMLIGITLMVIDAVVRVFVNHEARRRHPGAQHFLCVHVGTVDQQAAERPLQAVERQAGVEQGTDRHVAGDA
jgi:hypothetical protein